MNYQDRLELFCYWADYYGLEIIKAKFIPNDSDRAWAN